MNEIIIKNPITAIIKKSIDLNKRKLNLAVPYISSFILTILNETTTRNIKEKRLITKFDDSSLNSFDIPTLRKILDLGFEIRFDNKIHLKLYITDNDVFISSSNATQGGFENNIELSVKVDSDNNIQCQDIFDEIWLNSANNLISYDLLDENLQKYKVLKKRKTVENKTVDLLQNQEIITESLNVELLINQIFNAKTDYQWIKNGLFESNKLKAETFKKLKSGYDLEIFYVPKGHPKRQSCLIYELVYGPESKIAGTGLRENQFKEVFEHPEFKEIVFFIKPELIGLVPWNFNDENELLKFCNGIFEFKIPQFTETLPIRLATYFYPENFLPIFKLSDLKNVCEAFGFKANIKSKGDMLFIYNKLLLDKMKALPYDNYIKSNIAYQILFTVELFFKIENGENAESVITSYKEKWKQGFIKFGIDLLRKLGKIN